MVLIYSKKEVKIKGRVIDPKDFSGMPARGASVVYTNDAKIKAIYEDIGVEVKPIEGK